MKSKFVTVLALLTISLTGMTAVETSNATVIQSETSGRAPSSLLTAHQTALLFAEGGLQDLLMRRFRSIDQFRSEAYISFPSVPLKEIDWMGGMRPVITRMIKELVERRKIAGLARELHIYLRKPESSMGVTQDNLDMLREIVNQFE